MSTSRRVPPPWRIAVNFFTGRDLFRWDNRTDSTFFYNGADGESGWLFKNPTWWTLAAGWQRLGIRLAFLAVGPSWLVARWQTVWVLSLVTAVVAGVQVSRMWLWWIDRQMLRKYINPLGVVLGPLLSIPSSTRADSYITVEPGFKNDKTQPVVIELPAHFDGQENLKAAIITVVLGKLGAQSDSMAVDFKLEGSAPFVTFTMVPRPPATYYLPEAIDLIRELPVGHTLVGMAAEDEAVTINWMADDPHAAIQAGTGTGKTSFLLAQIAQWLRHGFRVSAIDPKMVSLDPMVPAPGFRVAADPDNVHEMWDVVDEMNTEMDSRMAIFKADRTTEFPLWFLVVDEMTMFASLDRDLWADEKEKKDTMKSPAFKGIIRLWLMGRQFGFRVVVVGQRIDEGVMRGFLGVSATRAMAKFQLGDWNRLFGGTGFQSPSSVKGRWFWRPNGNDPRAVQNLFLTDQEALDLARERTVADVPTPVPSEGETVTTSDDADQGDRDIVGVHHAAAVLEMPYETFKKRRQREKKAGRSIPGERLQGGQIVFDREALEQWAWQKTE